jgi:hypothetical protein
MKARTLWTLAMAAVVVAAAALLYATRDRQPDAARPADPAAPTLTPAEALEAQRFVNDYERERAASFQAEATAAAIAGARDEYDREWRAQRCDRFVTDSMAQAFNEALELEGAIAPPPARQRPDSQRPAQCDPSSVARDGEPPPQP